MSKIYRYIWISGGMRGHTYSALHFFFIIRKNAKSTRAWPILKSNSTSFDYFFHMMNNKKIPKRGPQGALLLFLYKVSIVVLIDFIDILLSPGIFLIQIVTTNNANMCLIHFHSKNNIKMCFPKRLDFKVQTHYRHPLSIAARWNKLRWHQQRLHDSLSLANLKKKLIILIYIVKKFEFFCSIFFFFFK